MYKLNLTHFSNTIKLNNLIKNFSDKPTKRIFMKNNYNRTHQPRQPVNIDDSLNKMVL